MSDEIAARLRQWMESRPFHELNADLRALLDERDRHIAHHAKQAQDIMTLSDELTRLRAPVEGEAGEMVKGLLYEAKQYAPGAWVGGRYEKAADIITRQAASLREAVEVMKGLLDGDLAVVDAYGMQRVTSARAFLAKHQGGDSEGR